MLSLLQQVTHPRRSHALQQAHEACLGAPRSTNTAEDLLVAHLEKQPEKARLSEYLGLAYTFECLPPHAAPRRTRAHLAAAMTAAGRRAVPPLAEAEIIVTQTAVVRHMITSSIAACAQLLPSLAQDRDFAARMEASFKQAGVQSHLQLAVARHVSAAHRHAFLGHFSTPAVDDLRHAFMALLNHMLADPTALNIAEQAPPRCYGPFSRGPCLAQRSCTPSTARRSPTSPPPSQINSPWRSCKPCTASTTAPQQSASTTSCAKPCKPTADASTSSSLRRCKPAPRLATSSKASLATVSATASPPTSAVARCRI